MYQRLQSSHIQQLPQSQLINKYYQLSQQSRSFSEWARNAQKQKLTLQQENIYLKQQIQHLQEIANNKDKLLNQSKKQLLDIKYQFKVLNQLLKKCINNTKNKRKHNTQRNQ